MLSNHSGIKLEINNKDLWENAQIFGNKITHFSITYGLKRTKKGNQ